MVLYKVNLTNDMECILSFTVVVKVISVLTPKVKIEEKTFKVKVFNKQFNDHDTFEGITEYTHLDWLSELRTFYRIDWPT